MAKTGLTGGKVPRVTRARKGAFDAAKQEAFLAELAATCNVSLAAERAGVTTGCVYEHKARDAAFRARWADALAEAYRNLELMTSRWWVREEPPSPCPRAARRSMRKREPPSPLLSTGWPRMV